MVKRRGSLLSGEFFNFLFGFIFIISISLGVVLAVNFYDVTTGDVIQTASALLFFK